jgi:predicted DNA-binding ribbon-helix-helix protein
MNKTNDMMTKIKFMPFVSKYNSAGIHGMRVVLTLDESFYSEHPGREGHDVMSKQIE